MATNSIDKESPEEKARAADAAEFQMPDRERRVPTRIERGVEVGREGGAPEQKEAAVPATERAAESPSATPVQVLPTARVIDPVTKEVEDILSEDLGSFYAKLSPKEQKVFRQEGEKAATKIRAMLEQVKVRARSIIDIIRRWLRLIPGVNRFFLEQEAKIKADRVMALHKKLHRR